MGFSTKGRSRFIRQLEALIKAQEAASESVTALAAATSADVAPAAESPLPARQAEQLEQVLSNGMSFLAGLFKMATGTDINLKDQKIEVDKTTGEVRLSFNMKRRLPIGIQDFVKIREEGFVYVDKTACIHKLITGSGGVLFLSRPRHFGKFQLCSTVKTIFEGRRELFSGLAIDKLEWEWKKHPVIHIDLNPGNHTLGIPVLNGQFNITFELFEKKYGLAKGMKDDPAGRFRQFLSGVTEKAGEKAVVIIDEYDKPLLSA